MGALRVCMITHRARLIEGRGFSTGYMTDRRHVTVFRQEAAVTLSLWLCTFELRVQTTPVGYSAPVAPGGSSTCVHGNPQCPFDRGTRYSGGCGGSTRIIDHNFVYNFFLGASYSALDAQDTGLQDWSLHFCCAASISKVTMV
jgi:hypothetical protein